MKTFVKNGRTYAKRQDLLPWDRNPRKIDPIRLADLIAEIKDHQARYADSDGQFKPIVTTITGLVVGGNQRMKAYEALHIDDVWVSVVDTENPKEAFKIAMQDNMAYGYYDKQAVVDLAVELELDQTEMESLFIETGDIKTIAQIKEDIAPDPDVDEDEAPAAEDEGESKPGKIYQLGRHRLMCGDATNPADVAKLMNNETAATVFTDPPYNVDYSGRGKKTSNKIKGDKQTDANFQLFLNDAIAAMASYVRKDGGLYVCYASRTHREFENALEASNFKVKNQIIWVKPVASMGWGDYRWKHEPILYASLLGKAVAYYGDRKQYTEWTFQPSDEELLFWAKEQIRIDEEGESTVWKISRDNVNNYDHPTQKPVKLPAKAILNSTQEGEIVLDTFGGSGTTLIAAEQTGRICYMMELDVRYVDVIRKRYAKWVDAKTTWQKATPEVTE